MEVWLYNHLDDTRQVVPVDGSVITIGRDAASVVRLQSTFVSRHHARIERSGNDFTIEGLGLNGTVVANRTLAPGERARLPREVKKTGGLVGPRRRPGGRSWV